MAKKITSISSGIYFRETDLTFIQNTAGTFAGASLGLMEKGPAFETMTSTSMSERTVRMGGINPLFRSSYFASEFLNQASNYKEVRMLGLEGYNENPDYIGENNETNIGGNGKMFTIAYKTTGSEPDPASTPTKITSIIVATGVIQIVVAGDLTTTFPEDKTIIISDITSVAGVNGKHKILSSAYNGTTHTTIELTTDGSAITDGTYLGGIILGEDPFVATTETIACILKPRRTGYVPATVSYVIVSTTPGNSTATDDEFTVTIYFEGDQTLYAPVSVICSLRPGSSQYITTVFGTSPRDNTLIGSNPSPLWVETVFPSVTAKLTAKGEEKYYYPGTETEGVSGKLALVEGNITVDMNFEYPSAGIKTIVYTTPATTITITSDYALGLISGSLISIDGLTTGEPALNGSWKVATASEVDPLFTYTITAIDGTVPTLTGSYTYRAGVYLSKTWTPTWESQIINLGGKDSLALEYQTPTTPWFVDKFDRNGNAKRLFRAWSISDGLSANTEIKLEIANIDPSGNGSFGSFDLYVRDFADTEDKSRTVYESFTNLTMNPKSTNYILRRIGDGENFPLQSKFIFIELNENETLPKTALPYGIEGYTNVTGFNLPDVTWTSQYDLTKSITKQTFGLANNSSNMFKKADGSYLIYKNVTGAITRGPGFHLNPAYVDPTPGSDAQQILNGFVIASANSYNTSDTNSTKLVGLNLVRRMKYVVDFEGGFDGWNVYSERTWDDTTSKDYEALSRAIDVLADAEDITTDFSVLVTPDINFQSYPAATSAILEMVETRGDALYLFDFNYRYTENQKPEIIPADAAQALLDNTNMLSSYAATYYPDVQLSDDTNNLNIWCPPSIVAFATIARTAMVENVWQPPAGSLRTVTDSIVRMRKRMKHDDREILKKVNINPITLFPGSGFEITESRTTQEAFSALSFIHNRLLLGYAKKALNQVLRPLLHQLKSDNLKSEFKNTVTPIFERIKKLNGLEEFSVSVDGSDEDRTTLNGVITIVPLYPVERIIVDFVLKDGSLEYNQ